MARMLWLKIATGTSLALSVGCQGPGGPCSASTCTPPPQFPQAKTVGSTSNPGATPTTPGIGDSRLRIGAPTAQSMPPATNAPAAKLRPADPTVAATPAIDSLPPGNGAPINAPRSLANGAPGDSNVAPVSFGSARYPVSAGNGIEAAPQIAPPPPMTSLPNQMPQMNSVTFPPVGANMPQANSFAPPPPPDFPAQPPMPSASFQMPPNPANNFPIPNTPNAPSISPQGPARANVYPPN